DGKTACFSFGLQEREITATIATEAEIIPDNQMLNTQTGNKNLIDKILSRQAAQALVELQTQHPVHPGGQQRLDFLAQAHQPGRRLITREKLMGLWLKYNHHRWQPV